MNFMEFVLISIGYNTLSCITKCIIFQEIRATQDRVLRLVLLYRLFDLDVGYILKYKKLIKN